MGRRAVFLDRDGVINSYVYNSEFGTVDSPSNPDEFELLPGVSEAIASIRTLGLLVVVVSNQPGIAKGKFSPEILSATTDKMMELCKGGIDAVYYCLHHPQSVHPQYLSDCVCRKPKPGLLLQAATEWDIDLSQSVMVGDGITDVIAGRDAGTKTILVSPYKCYLCEAMEKQQVSPDCQTPSLREAVKVIQSLYSKESLTIQGAIQHELLSDIH